LRDYHSCANSKNLVLVKHFVGGKFVQYQLPLHESFTSICVVKDIVTHYCSSTKITHLFLQCIRVDLLSMSHVTSQNNP